MEPSIIKIPTHRKRIGISMKKQLQICFLQKKKSTLFARVTHKRETLEDAKVSY